MSENAISSSWKRCFLIFKKIVNHPSIFWVAPDSELTSKKSSLISLKLACISWWSKQKSWLPNSLSSQSEPSFGHLPFFGQKLMMNPQYNGPILQWSEVCFNNGQSCRLQPFLIAKSASVKTEGLKAGESVIGTLKRKGVANVRGWWGFIWKERKGEKGIFGKWYEEKGWCWRKVVFVIGNGNEIE